ncbi:hypothetical protein [Actinomadura sp. DC4]|uniref:hypothetical protein n=1 Tax=Actinomadura sp. DC4 TaxID=3055069 RepID=UPI0025B0838B|nr:hypothetical protein [Actinomadura sp. DC4]MDN3356884.1 hypothetical protein [Actinomadura sp. DC4]
MRRITGGRRALAAAALAPAVLMASGCLGLTDEPPLASGLRRYTGKGFTVGYPKAWSRPAADRRVVPGSLFEVTTAAAGEPAGTFDILTHWGGTGLLDSVVSDFMRVSRSQRGFELIGQERIETNGHTGYQVREEYGAAPRRLRTVDWFAQLKDGTVIDVRIGFARERYDASLVAAIARSLSVR